MQLELKEFFLPFSPYFREVAEKIFERNKKPAEAKVFVCYVYLHDPSFKQTADLLVEIWCRTAKSVVRYLFQQVGADIVKRFPAEAT